jgi:hypothetical protein
MQSIEDRTSLILREGSFLVTLRLDLVVCFGVHIVVLAEKPFEILSQLALLGLPSRFLELGSEVLLPELLNVPLGIEQIAQRPLMQQRGA